MAEPVGATLVSLPPTTQLGIQLLPEAAPAAARALGIEALPAINRFVRGDRVEVVWRGPAEFFVIGGPETLEADLRSAIGVERGAVVDLSAARVGLELRGPAAREVLSTCATIDLHPRAFGPGSAAVTLVARVPVVLYQVDAEPTYRLLVQPTLRPFLVEWLTEGIRSGGRRRTDR